MITFEQWLTERGARTCLGIVPPAYGVAQRPPLAHIPASPTAALALTTIHKKTVDEMMKKPKKKKRKKRKKKD